MSSGTKLARDKEASRPGKPLNGASAAGHAAAVAVDDLPLLVIEPKRGWHFIDFRELWRYRELLYFLIWRDVKVRYKQTVLGAAWAVLQPLATMAVFTLFLARVAAQPDAAIAYPLFVFAGLLPWIFFANAINSAAQSVVGNQNLVTKIYFPRVSIPISAAGAGLLDFVIGLGMLAVLMGIYALGGRGGALGWGILLLPVIVLFLVIGALGIGTLLAALTVEYRDFRHVMPFLTQIWMFATPAIYLQSETVIGAQRALWLPLNPAHGLIANFRLAMLGGPINWYALIISSVVSVLFFLVGSLYFRRVEKNFADII
jgi:lipopolysaccharide transport system permease protein